MADVNLAGRTAVVTGAARGLGLGIARRLSQAQARVILADLENGPGAQAAEALRAEGWKAAFEPLDVRDPAACQAAVERLTSEGQGIDIWVNNAEVRYESPAETLPRERWDESLAIMLSGAFFCAQAVGRHMLARRSGVIVNVAGVNGYQPIEDQVAFSVAQAGLLMLTQALGVEWAPRGVRVVGVAPGAITGVPGPWAAAETPGGVNLRRTPLGRLGTIEETAEAVLFLVSDQASYVAAETLRVDGGWAAYQLF
jgi:NAD(P)-dependent dehydrogenase (short-subunit alcohol dehydrogenase family)